MIKMVFCRLFAYLLLISTTSLELFAQSTTVATQTTNNQTTNNQTTVPNMPPLLTSAFPNYKIIPKNIASGGVVHSIHAADPEKSKLLFSITGVTYYRNGTTSPIVASNKDWAVNKLPNQTNNACNIAESYPFPRNLFCIQANNNTIKATSKYNQFIKADYSLFRLDVVIFDNGVPQKNLTIKVYFRIKESCPQTPSLFSTFQRSCPKYLSVTSKTTSPLEVGYSFVIPNNYMISRFTISFPFQSNPRYIEENISFQFTFGSGSLPVTRTITRRLLQNVTLEQTLSVHLWNPVIITGHTGNVSVQFKMFGPQQISLFNYGIVVMHAIANTSYYCGNDTCVTLFKNIEYELRKTNQYECARDDAVLFVPKYSSCKALPKPPVWRNAKQNYVFINATSPAGTSVFKFDAIDVTSDSIVLFSVTGVTYYRKDTSNPASIFNKAWARTTAKTSNIIPDCQTAASYPYPRNLFCIDSLGNTIKTTGMFSNSRPSQSSLFVLDVFIATDGKPNMNVTGKLYVRIIQNCSIATKKSCQAGVGILNLRSFGTMFNFTVANATLEKINFDLFGFQPFDHIGKMVTYTLTYSKSGALISKVQRRMLISRAKESNLLVSFRSSLSSQILNGQISLTVSTGGEYLNAFRGYDFPIMKIYTLAAKDYCFDEICRVQYGQLHKILQARNSTECLSYDVMHLYNAKYTNCNVVFSPQPTSNSVSRDLSNGSTVLTSKAIANDDVFYSITSVSYWQNDSSTAIIARDSRWVVGTKSDAARSCIMSEKYSFPRNLFCVNQSGAVMATSSFRNRLQPGSAVTIHVLATAFGNPNNNATIIMYVFPQVTASECEPVKSTIISMDRACLSINPPIYPLQTKLSFYRFTAPANSSLLTQLGVRPSILAGLKFGDIYTYAVARAGGKSLAINRALLVRPSDRIRIDYVNTSLYREPIVLAPLEQIAITVTSMSGVIYREPLRNVLVVTVPVKEYCLTTCFDSFNKVVNYGGKLAARFHCKTLDLYSYDGKYGRCFANSPPSLRVANIITNVTPAGTIIGKLTGTDKEGTALTFGILSITSKLLKRNQTRTIITGQSCSESLNEQAPLNYLCVSHNTGDIIVSSKFRQDFGEMLIVKAFVVDSGTPKRYDVKSFTVSIRNPCEKIQALYKNVTSSKCFSGSNKITSAYSELPVTIQHIDISYLNLDSIMFLEIFPTFLSFPQNTIHTIFTLQAVTATRPIKAVGKQYNVTLSREQNTAKSVKLAVDFPVNVSWNLQISAVAVANVSQTPTVITLPPINNNQTEIKPLRKRRMVESISNVTSNGNYTTRYIPLLLSMQSVRVHGHSFKDFCGDISCVKTFLNWKEEMRKSGLSACRSDPLLAMAYFKNCSDPPKFSQHPKDINTQLASPASFSCSYQNFTGVTFQWMKDNKIYSPKTIIPRLNVEQRELSAQQSSLVSSSTTGKSSSTVSSHTSTTKTLLLDTSDPEMQGYYSCYVKDELNHVTTSEPSLLRFKDVSTSKMNMKIKKTFTNALKQTDSAEYKSFVNDVTATLQSRLNKIGLPSNRKIVLSNIRPGSVLVDANVYFLNVTNSTKKAVCDGLRNISNVQSSSNLEVSSLDLVPYDCCYTSQTGETQIKGIITWHPVIADAFDNRPCPYLKNGETRKSATRFCVANFIKGAQWLQPNISACPYKTKTTQKLEEISLTKIDASNAKTISAELDTVTSSVDKITNRLDIKFTADTINNLVKSKQKLEEITNDIINTTSNVMEMNPKLIGSAQASYNSSSKMLTSLDLLANSIPIAVNKTQTFSRKNVALAVKVVKTSSGLMIKATTGNTVGYNSLSITESSYEEKKFQGSAATIYLSEDMLRKVNALKKGSTNRIFSFVFQNSRLFLSKNAIDGNQTELKKINSRILSATIGDLTLKNLTQSEELTGLFQPLEMKTGKVDCVFWDFTFQDGFGAWSTNGCRSDGMQGDLHRCRCNHMTNFAILLDVTGKGTPPHAAKALSIVTYIGCGISLACLIITFLTFTIFKKLRTALPPRILICLCFSLIVTLIIFLAGVAAKDLKSCQAIGVLIHYFVLVSFGWMAVEGFNFYRSFVKIMNSGIHLFILKSSAVAWGVPAVIVAITAGATQLKAYGRKNGDEWICMVTGIPFYVAYLTPILLIVTINLIVLVYVLRSLKRSSRLSKDKKMTAPTQIRIAAACSVLMGTTWIIGLFAIDVLTLPVQILFCIFNSLQGLFIFIFYCLRNADARKQWKRVFGIRDKNVAKSSSGPDYARKGYSSDKPVAKNKAFSYQSKKQNYLQPSNEVQMGSFGKNATLTTTLPSDHSSTLRSTDTDVTIFLRDSRVVEDSPPLTEKGEKMPENGDVTHEPANGEKLRIYDEQTAEMTFGFEPVELSVTPILYNDDTKM